MIGISKRSRKLCWLPKRPGRTNWKIDQSSSRRFSIGVPVSARRVRADRRFAAWAYCVDDVLMYCASSSTTVSHSIDESRSMSRAITVYVVTIARCPGRRMISGRRSGP